MARVIQNVMSRMNRAFAMPTGRHALVQTAVPCRIRIKSFETWTPPNAMVLAHHRRLLPPRYHRRSRRGLSQAREGETPNPTPTGDLIRGGGGDGPGGRGGRKRERGSWRVSSAVTRIASTMCITSLKAILILCALHCLLPIFRAR